MKMLPLKQLKEDTAKSAAYIKENKVKHVAATASKAQKSMV